MKSSQLLQYGFDESHITERLELLGFRTEDSNLSEILQQSVIQPNVDVIVDEFYDYLMKHHVYVQLLTPFSIDSLKETQKQYLLSLGVGYATPEYFEQRLTVGRAHERVGLKLGLYQCAYHQLQALILKRIPDSFAAITGQYSELTNFIVKITTLDLSLAVEAYYLNRVHDLKRSIDTMRYQGVLLRRRIDTDSLTGLASHDYALDVLEQALRNVRQDNHPLCVIMGDLDYFKEVNDHYGHLVGDKVLLDVAKRIQSPLRTFDVVGRYGGEEFLMILDRADRTRALEIAERIRKNVSGGPIHVNDINVPMTISQGVSVARKTDTIEMLIDRADKAMYHAKIAGKNCVRVEADLRVTN